MKYPLMPLLFCVAGCVKNDQIVAMNNTAPEVAEIIQNLEQGNEAVLEPFFCTNKLFLMFMSETVLWWNINHITKQRQTMCLSKCLIMLLPTPTVTVLFFLTIKKFY